MIYKVIITDLAFDDLRGIKKYISDELVNPEAADEFIDAAFEIIFALDEMPKRHGIISDEIIPVSYGVRRAPIRNHDVFYRVNDDKKVVSILRVAYQKREWSSLFNLE